MITGHCVLILAAAWSAPAASEDFDKRLAPFFRPPAEFANARGAYKSPLSFSDGKPVKSADDWLKRRREILILQRLLSRAATSGRKLL